MKKFITLFAAVAATFCLASCVKSEIDSVSKEIKLNIKVADLNEPASKAVKTGWTNDDKINIWYDSNVSADPDLVIKYDGIEWIFDETATLSGKRPSASGNIRFIFEGNNDLSTYSKEEYTDIYCNYSGTANLVYGDDYYHKTGYTFAENVLEFEITDWVPLSEVQVVITGIDPERYQLKCDKLQKFSGIYVKFDESFLSTVGCDEYTDGVANSDGAAFYFSCTNTDGKSADYTFTLYDKSSCLEINTYTAYGKTINRKQFTAIKIAGSKFLYN